MAKKKVQLPPAEKSGSSPTRKKKPAAKQGAISLKKKAAASDAAQPRCGLCGKKENLIKTECCGQWICDDEHNYQLFSFATNSCIRNHRRYTLCSHHFNEGHTGDWKECKKCLKSFETEMYVWYGTNEFNFEVLPNPPAFEPTKCVECGRVISLGTEAHSYSADGYRCAGCIRF